MAARSKLYLLGAVLVLVQCALGQQAAEVRYGTWTASVGPSQIFRGTWSAEISPRSPDAARGAWTLLNDSADLVLEGTWSARRTGSRWHGTWRAQTARGQSFSGTWDADLPDSKGASFADMLTLAIEKQVAGSWRSGRFVAKWPVARLLVVERLQAEEE